MLIIHELDFLVYNAATRISIFVDDIETGIVATYSFLERRTEKGLNISPDNRYFLLSWHWKVLLSIHQKLLKVRQSESSSVSIFSLYLQTLKAYSAFVMR